MIETLQTRKEELKKQGKKGFTLMEMLIVIAIIAVLIAIAIPIFTSQLEKANEAKDAANLRSAYAVASASLLTDNATASEVSAGPVTLTQSGAFDQLGNNEMIGDFKLSGANIASPAYVHVTANPTGGAKMVSITNSPATVNVDPVTGKAAAASTGGQTGGQTGDQTGGQ